MINLKSEIIAILKQSVKEFTKEEVNFLVEKPENESFGDYSSNIALMLFGKVSKEFGTPMELAEKIVSKFRVQNSEPRIIEKVEAVKPGFINFWLSKEFLISQLDVILNKTPLRSASPNFAGRRVMVEFTDPNPFKEFHIGHLYSNTVGEAICRLLESQGAEVLRVCYQGDVGLHIAKSLYAILQISNLKSQISNLEHKSTKGRAEFLGKCYAVGAKAYEDDEKAKKEIEKINKEIYEKDPKIMPLYKKGREWSLDYFDKIYRRLGTRFKKFYFEGKVGKEGIKIVKDHIGDVFEESKKAVIFPGDKYSLHNRVFINSLGLPTYEAKDLGLAIKKYKDFPYDLSIIITAKEQSDYFRVVLKALSLIEPELARKTAHIAHGVVRLPTGKMSSRTGSIILGEWLLDEAKHRIITKYKEMDQDTAEKVSVGAVKYALLKSGIGRDIDFDFDTSISLEGNSGSYLQYTFTRTQSVLAKARIKNYELRIMNLEVEPEEVSILRSLYRFPEVVEEIGEKFAPNLLCNYLFDLAQKFNLFYQKVPIIKQVKSLGANLKHLGGANPEQREFRLALTKAVGQVIKNGLYLLGIKAPTQM